MEGSRNQVKLLIASELADRWQVPTSQIYRLAREGQIPTVRIGRYRRFRLDHIEAFEARGGELGGDPLFDALAADDRKSNTPSAVDLDCHCESRPNEYRGRDGWWHCFNCDGRVEVES